MTILPLISFVLFLFSLPVFLYLGIMAVLAWRPREISYSEPKLRFVILVPAHDEQGKVGQTVRSLLSIDYPKNLVEVVVIADNCSDATAEEAREAGAEIIERNDPNNRGKGFALEYAFQRIVEENRSDAVVVIDADTLVSDNLLSAFQERLLNGEGVIQAEYGVRNVHASWRTKLMTVAMALFHRTRSLARERMGVSVGLRGNGMCFSFDIIKAHPHRAHSLVEDVEYGIELSLSGHRVAFAEEAQILGEMVSTGEAAVSQRKRWEEGRWHLTRKYTPPLLHKALRHQSLLLFDLAMDLLVPPLSYVGIIGIVGLCLEGTYYLTTGQLSPNIYLWFGSLLCLALYVMRGVQHSRLGLQGVLVLCYAPVYVAWKLLIARPFGSRGTGKWIRTKREDDSK